ncbi:MAG: hypothetical protein L6E13_12355 [Firmicutes bacterium]|nr:hypothetical protein [Bacillota bacterium]
MRRVEYKDQEILIHTRSGWRLLDSLAEQGVAVECDCNPKAGTSTARCAVKYPKAEAFLLTAPTEFEYKVLGPEKVAQGWRLGCQALWK